MTGGFGQRGGEADPSQRAKPLPNAAWFAFAFALAALAAHHAWWSAAL